MDLKLDIIIPCFNEEENIEYVFKETEKVAAQIPGYTFNYIFVDDGSTDDTLSKIKNLSKDNICVNYIALSRNFGKEAAMYAGMRNSQGDFAVIMDADLQHPPTLIEEMLKRIEETGCDCCAARRVSRKGEPVIRSLFARMFYKIMNRFSDIKVVDGAVDFRIMRRRVVKAIVSMPETQRFSKGIFEWVGFDTEWVEFENRKRIAGETKWSVWGLCRYALDGFINFTTSPLKYIGVAGSIITFGSAVYMIVEVVKTLVYGPDTPGYASIICFILFFGGVTITILSIIGEYLGRMYMETKGRPIYIEKDSSFERED